MKSTLKSTINRKRIEEKILEFLKESTQPVSTTDIASELGISWHTVIRHCLNLELEEKVSKFTVGRISMWIIERNKK